MTRLIFLDTETTGLDPDRHDVWEIALIVRHDDGDQENVAQLPISAARMAQADPYGLRVGRYYARRFASFETAFDASCALVGENANPGAGVGSVVPVAAYAAWLARTLDGATIVGAVPDFDVRFLSRWLNAHGQPWTAHYHLCDVENLAVGYLASEVADARRTETVTTYDPAVIDPPWSSDALSAALGVTINEADRHTALGDARWARDMYDAVMGFA